MIIQDGDIYINQKGSTLEFKFIRGKLNARHGTQPDFYTTGLLPADVLFNLNDRGWKLSKNSLIRRYIHSLPKDII